MSAEPDRAQYLAESATDLVCPEVVSGHRCGMPPGRQAGDAPLTRARLHAPGPRGFQTQWQPAEGSQNFSSLSFFACFVYRLQFLIE